MKAGRRILSLLLTVCMLLCMLPTAAFAASGDDYMKVAMLDSGRKYFTVDWVKSFIYEAKADGYTHVMLAIGNDGMRFLLDDMSLTVNSQTYSSDAVRSAIHAGNTNYTTDSTGEWTESEMDEIFATANAAGIEIIPLLNSPGHMDAVLYAASSLTGVTCSYNSSVRTIDVTNTTAVAFSQAFIQKYIDYFAGKGCKYFNFGADEYANDRYTSGGMGFGNLQSTNKYGYFIKYVNELAAMVKNAGLTPIAFNDGIEYSNKTSATVGSTTYTFDKDIVICYWSSGWSGYTLRTAANLASDGFKLINTTGDFYYVLGKSDNFDSSYTYASNWSNYKVCGTTISSSSVLGGMFCMWSDYPGAETETQEAKKIRLPLRAMGLAMNDSYTSSLDQSVVAGGFNADGTLNTDPPAQVHHYEVTATKAATCTEPGSVTYTCTDCGDSYTETVAALGHDYAAKDDNGDTIYTCTRCGDTYTELLPRENIALKAGETSDVYTLEGEQTVTYAGDAAIAKANLNYIQGTGTAVSYSATASASVSGYTDGGYNCVASNLIDGDTSTYYWSTSSQTSGMYARVDLGAEVRFDAVQISAPAHGDYCTNANVQVSSDGRTWTTIGTYTSSRSTAVTSTYEVPASVESFRYIQVAITTARSYWWQLSEIAWGSYDGTTFTRAATSGTVRNGTQTNTELSFTGVAAGTTAYVVDGTKYVVTVEASHEHSYEKTGETAPTCTEDGSITYTCTECGDTYTETVPANGHSYTSAVTKPTCTRDGYTTYTCTVCGDSYTADTTKALGHDYQETVVAATCTEDGTKTYTCTRCGDSYTDSTVAALGHDYACTEDGDYLVYTCTRCGDSYTEEKMPTVAVNLQVGETYTFTTEDATVSEDIDTSVATMDVTTLGGDYQQVSEITDGKYLLVTGGSLMTANASTYYSSWDGAGTVSGLSCTNYTAGGSYDDALWTITEVDGGYTIQSADGRYLNLTAATRSSSISLSDEPQVITINDLGGKFSIQYSNVYLDRFSSAFVGAYPGNGNDNEQWQLYKAEPEGYQVTITAVAGGKTSPVIGGTRYAIDVHAHDYSSLVTKEATCTASGERTYTCAGCGDTYTEVIPATGHNYGCTETDDSYIYTCVNCGDTYTEAKVTTSYSSVSAISSGNNYVITVYSGGSYYAMTHNGTTVGAVAVTVSDGKITSEVSDDMLWSYSGNKFSFTSGGRTYYLGRSGSGLRISTSGTTASYRNSRLSLSNYYLRYSGGYFSLSRYYSSTCYMFVESK